MNEQTQTTPAPETSGPVEKPAGTQPSIQIAAAAPADIAPQTQSSPMGLPDNKPEPAANLGDDVLVEFSLFVRSREGTIVNIENCLRLPMAMDSALLVDAPNQFENALDRFLVRPAKMKFNHVVLKAKEAEDKKRQPIGAGSLVEARSDTTDPLLFVSPRSSNDYPSSLAECIAHNRRLDAGN